VAGGLTASALIVACGSSPGTLDTARVQHAIEASILAQHELHTVVVCPSNVPLHAGHAFTCTARLEAGSYPVTVTETNGSGHVRYENRAPLLALDIAKVRRAITASIARQRALTASVDCPKEVLQQAGVAFTCTAVVRGSSRRYPFAVTEVNDSGRVRYYGR
jgi:hypothetical protein